MKVISVRENPENVFEFIKYFQNKWASEESMAVYEDCIKNCISSKSPLPNWYLLKNDNKIIGCVGLITNDFISRMDLYPWLCALFIEEKYRGNNYGKLLIDRCVEDTKKMGFEALYLSTDHIGYYEHFGFQYMAEGFHPWGESSKIYMRVLK